MPVALFYFGTAVLALCSLVCWAFAEWAFAECWGVNGFVPFWLLVSGVSTALAAYLFAAFVCNVVDIASLLWRPKRKPDR